MKRMSTLCTLWPAACVSFAANVSFAAGVLFAACVALAACASTPPPPPPIDLGGLTRGSCPVDALESDRGCITVPRVVKKVPPPYPVPARTAGVEGSVLLSARIDVTGEVTEVGVIEATPPEAGFDEAAVWAVRNWRYLPARLAGSPVPVLYTIKVEFKLDAPREYQESEEPGR